jgi:hypothetical protein
MARISHKPTLKASSELNRVSQLPQYRQSTCYSNLIKTNKQTSSRISEFSLVPKQSNPKLQSKIRPIMVHQLRLQTRANLRNPKKLRFQLQTSNQITSQKLPSQSKYPLIRHNNLTPLPVHDLHSIKAYSCRYNMDSMIERWRKQVKSSEKKAPL